MRLYQGDERERERECSNSRKTLILKDIIRQVHLDLSNSQSALLYYKQRESIQFKDGVQNGTIVRHSLRHEDLAVPVGTMWTYWRSCLNNA